MKKIIFVKTGTKYTADDVNVLHDSLKPYFDLPFFCYTDDPTGVNCETIPVFKRPNLWKWWNKLSMFRKDFPVKGEMLFFDLDTVVNSDPSEFIGWGDRPRFVKAHWKDDLFAREHAYETWMNSQVITWRSDRCFHIWDLFIENADYYQRKYAGIDRFIWHEEIFHTTFPTDLVHSFKYEQGKNAPITTFEEVDFHVAKGN